jgi:hypothetical protein
MSIDIYRIKDIYDFMLFFTSCMRGLPPAMNDYLRQRGALRSIILRAMDVLTLACLILKLFFRKGHMFIHRIQDCPPVRTVREMENN